MSLANILFLVIIAILLIFGYWIQRLEKELSKTLKILGYYSLRYGKHSEEKMLNWLNKNINKIKK
jgi:hypothetical protein